MDFLARFIGLIRIGDKKAVAVITTVLEVLNKEVR
jgi:hypothetical protein